MWPFSKPTLQVYNTLTRSVEPVRARTNTVSVYSCGPTVYGAPHIGNMRAFVIADTLNRTLRSLGYTVDHVINITDVGHLTDDADLGEDKVELAARRTGRSAAEITEENIELFFRDLARMNIDPARYRFPRASKYIPEQIAFIQTLESKGYTYTTKDGVYFDTARFPRYGALSRESAHTKEAGKRIAQGEKRNTTDFALWKFSDPATKRQQEWESPWGVGFPGWHLECSAMVRALLGEQIDIHTGGMDHIPVHHENEIAQSEAATGIHPYVRTWVHGAFITVNKEKISKSLGNDITLDDLLKHNIEPLAYRLWLLQGSYRSPMNVTWDALEAAQVALTRLRASVKRASGGALDARLLKEVQAHMLKNLDTPKVLALLHVHLPTMSRNTLEAIDAFLGLSLLQTEETIPSDITDLVSAREEARQQKNYAESDRIRDALFARGYRIDDTEDGPSVQKV